MAEKTCPKCNGKGYTEYGGWFLGFTLWCNLCNRTGRIYDKIRS